MVELLLDAAQRRIIRFMGVRGMMKSAYHSFRMTRVPHRLLLHRNVLTALDSGASVDIDGHLLVGLSIHGVTHPNMGNSKLSVSEGGKLSVNAPGTYAAIGPQSRVHVEGHFSIGSESYINSQATIVCGERISIGDNCALAWDVQIVDDNRNSLELGGKEQPRKAPVIIKDNVWVGANVSIKKGVTIGEGAVVASDSVVTKDVPPHALVAGTPAEVKREDVTGWGGYTRSD